MKKYLILSKSKYEMKLALLEDNKLDEMYIERNNQKEITGNIYKGKVVDILNNGEIIFVDIGLEKNALLSFENKKNIPKFNLANLISSDLSNTFHFVSRINISLVSLFFITISGFTLKISFLILVLFNFIFEKIEQELSCVLIIN